MSTPSVPDEPQHTPGPWRVSSDTYIECTRGDREFFTVAEAYKDCEVPIEEVQANARLIAAAPWLLAACEMMLPFVIGRVRDVAREAIAKAKGGA